MMMTASGLAIRQPRVGLWQRLFGGKGDTMGDVYAAVVAEARRPIWYRDCGVPDTLDGRFDMLALVLSLVLLRLEHHDRPHEQVRLTERFVDDIDGQMRQSGFGDLVVGKQVGGTVAALGGRLGAYRGGVTQAALLRNLWRGLPPDAATVSQAEGEIAALEARLDAAPLDALLAGRFA